MIFIKKNHSFHIFNIYNNIEKKSFIIFQFLFYNILIKKNIFFILVFIINIYKNLKYVKLFLFLFFVLYFDFNFFTIIY